MMYLVRHMDLSDWAVDSPVEQAAAPEDTPLARAAEANAARVHRITEGADQLLAKPYVQARTLASERRRE